MLRLTEGNIARLRPDLGIWRQGHLRLDSNEEQLCYFWSRQQELITRQSFTTAGPKLLVAHPTHHVGYDGQFHLRVLHGYHLYRIVPEPGCVERAPEPDDFFLPYTGRDYLTFEAVYFTRPEGSIPVEVTYLGTALHED